MKLKILVPVDVEDPRSWSAVLPELRQHAKGNDVELTVVTVVPELGTVIAQAAQALPFAATLPGDLRDRVLAVARERLEDMAQIEDFGTIQRIVRSGTIYSEILRTADDLSTDLFVLMSHLPDIGDYLLGPNAAKIVRHARCSVLVVRPR
ncbi:universal stress protein [Labrenzia sp. DG1229]|uniref:universal stress protein n=1 Tax=Labrenzia sp. DG1229 TaxID=681847 RepID=UPI0004915DA3|nr:universal stress protein [Labrenzia sp. DG1229]